MSSPLAELSELADRVERGVEDGSLSSERAVQLRAVEPLLELLGWDVRSSEVVPEATLGAHEFEYLLAVDDAPLVIVGTVPPSEPLDETVAARLERTIADRHVPRGIATDGRGIVLLAASDGEVHRRSLPFAALPDHAEALGRYHRSVVASGGSPDRADRTAAGQRLEADRDAVVDAITEEIVAVADEPVEDAVAHEAARAVDSLISSLGNDDGNGSESSQPDPVVDEDVPSSEGTVRANSAAGTANSADPADQRSASEVDGDGEYPGGPGDGEPAPAERDGEYVVRFFGGSSSVGAVGTETPRGTTVGTIRCLLENHGLANSITVPWRDEDGTVVLSNEPAGGDWTTLSSAAGDRIAVRPIDEAATARRTIEGLVEAAGLRAMFQGDW